MPLTDVFSYRRDYFDDVIPTKPWRFKGWLWATQGHILVALADDGSDADPTPEKFTKADRYLSEEPSGVITATLQSLLAFSGKIQAADQQCEGCDGEGIEQFGDEHKCEHCGKQTRPACEWCGGDGRVPCSPRYGRLVGVLINRALLAFALSVVPQDEQVRIGVMASVNKKDYPAVMVLGASWRIAVMCTTAEVGTVPVFPSVEDSPVAVAVPAEAMTSEGA